MDPSGFGQLSSLNVSTSPVILKKIVGFIEAIHRKCFYIKGQVLLFFSFFFVTDNVNDDELIIIKQIMLMIGRPLSSS